MAKFVNKKEQVFDLKLTSYGHYLLSVGKFKPTHYAFYDDNVLYDRRYAYSSASEKQNDVHARIKNETQYIESLVLFRDVEETLKTSVGEEPSPNDKLTPSSRSKVPASDIFKFDSQIGDAFLDGETNYTPAWKIVALQNQISSSTQSDTVNDTKIPQLNIDANYSIQVSEPIFNLRARELRELNSYSNQFIDQKVLKLVSDDPLFYIEELNTENLTQNFDIEVFLILSSSAAGSREQLERKFFRKEIPQIQNGFLMSEVAQVLPVDEITTDSVEYYFTIDKDGQIDPKIACKYLNQFNTEDYLVDLDYDCGEDDDEELFFDIYGRVTESEICPD